MWGRVGGSGLQSKPGVPQTGWRSKDIEDLGGRNEICEWCGKKRIRYVHTMSHPDWPDLVRVGSHCAIRMGDTFAHQREREFRRNPDKWHQQAANGTPVDSERGGVGDYLLRRWWALSPQGEWLGAIFWLLVIIAALFFLNRP
jgi:hypothetical protein